MSKPSFMRTLFALAITLLFLLLLVLLLFATDIGFRVWDHLNRSSYWFKAFYLSGVVLFAVPFGIWIWRLLRPNKGILLPEDGSPPQNLEEIEQRLQKSKEQGIDTHSAEATLDTLHEDRAAGVLRVAVFGEISSGKSALVGALVPDSETESSVLGGTTRQTYEYSWLSPAGDRLVLIDMPGLNESGGQLDQLAREEALRSHIVIYLCEGELTRDQHRELEVLLELDKPIILALNKVDRLPPREVDLIQERLREQADRVEEVVAISSGGKQTVVEQSLQGEKQQTTRSMPPKVDALLLALQRLIDGDHTLLNQLRDRNLFVLAARQLDQAEAEYRKKQAEKVVHSYAQKAVLGALAAVTPGTDLLIQGYLGTQLIRELTQLYQVPLRKIDSDHLISLAQQRLTKKHTVLLALAGNAMKVFPGLGTLGGGLLHAVAYGMIFESLGRAVAEGLAHRTEVSPVSMATRFDQCLDENLEMTAQRFAKLVADEVKERSKKT